MAQTATITSYEYAAGTCTLRLVGELSPLSQVTGRPVLGRSRFYLQVHGEELDTATEAVANQTRFEVSGREPQFSALAALVQTYVQRQLSADALTEGGAVSQGDSALQPVGLTRHRLTLVTPLEPPNIVELSTLQLADLADALEQAEGSLQILPDATPVKARRTRPRLPLWVGSVAAVGIAALLGNQFLTTTPSPVVLSPSGPQTTNESGQPLPSDRQQSLEGGGGASPADLPAAESVEAPPAAGEALPAPTTTAPTTPDAPPSGSTDAVTPKASPPPSAATPAPASGQPPLSPTPAEPNTDASAEAEAGVETQLASPNSDMTAESTPAPASPETMQSARSNPEAFAGPGHTASPSPALEWISALTLALQQQWRPPANLAATLRYSLTLEPDGTVTALEPLSDFSATYRNSPALPQPGTTIPGVVRDEPATVEVQFLPTGEVVVVPPGR
ncbi:DUF4335 domain-containing protein [Nodosilinea sp. LEGE 06152]|uniref:DUF4335 domain-containing protein n=1 Tax=Nodosilinea sp. LEGE 06152 TaxID=2777966 RepID=UPI00188042CC|nr:DUF4335 domain-containing protein [Nodosilinea sp. LEGE 06152]MBE9157604.1 DUF4335 domain-containing protein [Nodosilinea sp. LEGE 06152]